MRFGFYSLIILAILSGCGFQPVHQKMEQSSGHALEEVGVYVEGDTRLSQIFRIALEDAMHPDGQAAAHSKYQLQATINEIKQAIIIERDASITRYNLIFQADYRVTEEATGKLIVGRRSQRISSYNVSESDFATYVAERDARKRGSEQLAQAISREVAAALGENQQ